MVVDSSAVIAILRNEVDAPDFAVRIEQATSPLLSAATLLELGIVLLHREGAAFLDDLFDFVRYSGIEIVALTEAHAHLAIHAYSRFGKSSRHPAQLNYGDCFSYALAKSLDAPLLFKGGDFAHTDIRSAL